MKQAEITGLTLDELKERIAVFEENLQKMELTHTISQLENPLSIRHTRRSIARMKTELRKRQITKA
jgi:large subunit ribosomal protein L29